MTKPLRVPFVTSSPSYPVSLIVQSTHNPVIAALELGHDLDLAKDTFESVSLERAAWGKQ